MKNFVFAFLTFLIWAYFGAWIHQMRHKPTAVLPKIESENTINQVKQDSIKTIVSVPDSLSKPEVVKAFPKKIIYLGFDQKDFVETDTLDLITNAIKKYIKQNPKSEIFVDGFTDSTGDSTANYWIGFERAKNFKAFLVKQGLDKDLIHTASKGETSPLAKNSTIEERRKNRRIEITIKPKNN